MTQRIASIDFGTNTARLLIADCVSSTCFNQLCLEREIVRMGGGFCRENGLSPDAWERGLACLERFAEIMKRYGVEQVRAVATSAVRDAVNGREFTDVVLQKTGINLRVIDGIEEGHLTLTGVWCGLDEPHKDVLLFDVGGGSTEFTRAQGSRTTFVRSLPLGVVRLTEGKGTPAAMSEKIRKELNGYLDSARLEQPAITGDTILVGSAGTATTLAAIHLEMKEYDYRRVNNAILTRQQISDIYERLVGLSPAERLKISGLEQGREDLIIAGCLITLNTMDMLGFDRMKVSDYGMLEGLLVEEGARYPG